MTLIKDETIEKIKIFFLNFGKTLKKSVIWLMISYIIPLLNILILRGIRRDEFVIDINILSIIIATNSCIITSLLHLFYQNEKKREMAYVVSVLTIVISVALYVLCLLQVELKNDFIQIEIYKFGSFTTLAVSILLLLITKYDEVEALSIYRADKGKGTTTTEIEGKKIKI
ncbi:MAG: hypothetical protein HRU80_13410 [Ignavibacteriales bacterium]|nr:MAG: hypothetical protein HRU80_13410 [Ignavibacteriales bacterium]